MAGSRRSQGKLYRLRYKLHVFYNKLPKSVKSFLDFFRFITEYGILISIMMAGVFNVEFSILRLYGFGLAYYFIMYEVRAVINAWRGR